MTLTYVCRVHFITVCVVVVVVVVVIIVAAEEGVVVIIDFVFVSCFFLLLTSFDASDIKWCKSNGTCSHFTHIQCDWKVWISTRDQVSSLELTCKNTQATFLLD